MATQTAILDSQMECFKQFWISMSLQCFPSSFSSIKLMVLEMLFEEFQDGRHASHPGYPNRTILVILNLYVTPIPPIKFWRISRWPPWQPSWISELNDFSNCESLFCSNASHQVSAQSDLWPGRCPLKNFNMAPVAAILDIWMEGF